MFVWALQVLTVRALFQPPVRIINNSWNRCWLILWKDCLTKFHISNWISFWKGLKFCFGTPRGCLVQTGKFSLESVEGFGLNIVCEWMNEDSWFYIIDLIMFLNFWSWWKNLLAGLPWSVEVLSFGPFTCWRHLQWWLMKRVLYTFIPLCYPCSRVWRGSRKLGAVWLNDVTSFILSFLKYCFPHLAEMVSIFSVEVVKVLLNFYGFSAAALFFRQNFHFVELHVVLLYSDLSGCWSLRCRSCSFTRVFLLFPRRLGHRME